MSVFTKEEIRDMLIAVVVISFIFSMPNFQTAFLESAVIVVIAFLTHELAHKFMARRFGSAAVFKVWPMGLLIGLVFSIIGIKFIAPGAVVISAYKFGRWKFNMPHIKMKEVGIISAVGPLTNILIAAIFLSFPGSFFTKLVSINSFLALFNLLPIQPLDGSKVFGWKPWVWFLMILISFILILRFAIF